MPDLSLLVELADFYDVDIREIIDGERKSEKMNQEEKATLLKVADYSENERNVLMKKGSHYKYHRFSSIIACIVVSFIQIRRNESASHVYRGSMLWICGWGTAYMCFLYYRSSFKNQK